MGEAAFPDLEAEVQAAAVGLLRAAAAASERFFERKASDVLPHRFRGAEAGREATQVSPRWLRSHARRLLLRPP